MCLKRQSLFSCASRLQCPVRRRKWLFVGLAPASAWGQGAPGSRCCGWSSWPRTCSVEQRLDFRVTYRIVCLHQSTASFGKSAIGLFISRKANMGMQAPTGVRVAVVRAVSLVREECKTTGCSYLTQHFDMIVYTIGTGPNLGVKLVLLLLRSMTVPSDP